MITTLITIIVYICVIGLLYWLAMYVLDNIPLPEPVGKVARILVMVVVILAVIMLLLSLVGGGGLGNLNLSIK
jgi:hypothetical protein